MRSYDRYTLPGTYDEAREDWMRASIREQVAAETKKEQERQAALHRDLSSSPPPPRSRHRRVSTATTAFQSSIRELEGRIDLNQADTARNGQVNGQGSSSSAPREGGPGFLTSLALCCEIFDAPELATEEAYYLDRMAPDFLPDVAQMRSAPK